MLRFSQPELLYSRRVYDTGIISNTQWFRVFDQHGDLPLTRELFCHNALIFERLRSQTLSLINTRTGKAVAMDISAFPYVGVWSPYRDDASFVCLEPWQSMGMSEHEGSELSQKRGMHCLAPKAWEETGFSMTFQPSSNH